MSAAMAAKLVVLLALVALVYARDQILEENTDNDITKFEYDIANANTGDFKSHEESRIGEVVRGKYKLLEPDGSTRTVYYTAGDEGFNAVVLKQPSNPSTTDVKEDPLVDNKRPCFSGKPYIPKKSSLNSLPASPVGSLDPISQFVDEFPQILNNEANVSLDNMTDKSSVPVSTVSIDTLNSLPEATTVSAIPKTSFISQTPSLSIQTPVFIQPYLKSPAVQEPFAREYLKSSSYIIPLQSHDQPTYSAKYPVVNAEPTSFFAPFSSGIQERPTLIQKTPQVINFPTQTTQAQEKLLSNTPQYVFYGQSPTYTAQYPGPSKNPLTFVTSSTTNNLKRPHEIANTPTLISGYPDLAAVDQDILKLLVNAPEYLTYSQPPNYAENYIKPSAKSSTFVTPTPTALQEAPTFIINSFPDRPTPTDQTPGAQVLISNAPEYFTAGEVSTFDKSYLAPTTEPSVLVTPKSTGILKSPAQFTNPTALNSDRITPIAQELETTDSLAKDPEYLSQQFSQQLKYYPSILERSVYKNFNQPTGSILLEPVSSKAFEESTASLYAGSRPYIYYTTPFNPYSYSYPSLLQSSSNLQEQLYKSSRYSLLDIQPNLSEYAAGNFYSYPWKK